MIIVFAPDVVAAIISASNSAHAIATRRILMTLPFASHSIEQIDPARLRPWARNARTHSRKQIRQVADSIQTFGFTSPVLIDAEHTILAGHCRVEAAKLLGLASVPCIRIETMTPAEKR